MEKVFWNKKNLLKICQGLLKYKPDILALVEIQTKSSFGRRRYDNIIKKEMGMEHSLIKSKYLFKGFSKILKYLPGIKKQSNAFFSKRNLCDSEFVYFDEGIKKLVIKISVRLPKKVTFFIVHLALLKDTRQEQINELTEMVNNIKTPIIVAGDFNNFDGAKELNNLIKNTRLKKIKETFTYPAFHPDKIIDHILISSEIKIKSYEVLKLKLSDHLPVMIDFKIK